MTDPKPETRHERAVTTGPEAGLRSGIGPDAVELNQIQGADTLKDATDKAGQGAQTDTDKRG
jgi:hypothetical protein